MCYSSCMKRGSTPVRIDPDLYASASSVAPVMSRSIAQQIAHWARIGMELEASPGTSIGSVAGVLRGTTSYDDLGSEEQAVVRAYWTERMRELVDSLRLDEEFAAAQRPYVELDDDGRIVLRTPQG